MIHNKKYSKQEIQPQRKLSIWQSFSSAVTNIRYSFNKKIHELKQVFDPDESQAKSIIIQGKRFINRSMAKSALHRIIWFSYRKGFNISDYYSSDVGWGCLIRVGQMALASALLKYFQELNPEVIKVQDSDIESILAAFQDGQGSEVKYSLNKILLTANSYHNVKPGEWHNLSKISKYLEVLQNKRPMRGSANLKIVSFDQSINIPTIFQILKLPLCKCRTKKTIVCSNCHSSYSSQNQQLRRKSTKNCRIIDKDKWNQYNNQDFLTESNFKKNKFSFTKSGIIPTISKNYSKYYDGTQLFRKDLFLQDLFIIVLSRASQRQNPQRVNKAIFILLDLNFCLGIMTGFPKQAIFVVGRQQNKLIYLDPHFVQQKLFKDLQNKGSCFCNQYLTCERTQLDPSMAFCFYLKNISQLEFLSHAIENVNLKYPDALSISVDFNNPLINLEDFDEEDDEISSLNSCFVVD